MLSRGPAAESRYRLAGSEELTRSGPTQSGPGGCTVTATDNA